MSQEMYGHGQVPDNQPAAGHTYPGSDMPTQEFAAVPAQPLPPPHPGQPAGGYVEYSHSVYTAQQQVYGPNQGGQPGPGLVYAVPQQVVQPQPPPAPGNYVVPPQPPKKRHHKKIWAFGGVLAVTVAGVTSCDVIYNNTDGIKYITGDHIGNGVPRGTNPAGGKNASKPNGGKAGSGTHASQAPASPNAPIIVLDPAYSGADKTVTRQVLVDGRTYTIQDQDFLVEPAVNETFDVASCTGDALAKDGRYKTSLTKPNVAAFRGIVDRAAFINKQNADLAMTILIDHSLPASTQLIYDQKGLKHGGQYHDMFRYDAHGKQITFPYPQLAAQSQIDAGAIAAARAQAQGVTVQAAEAQIGTVHGHSLGNIKMVQLLSNRPEVYNVAGADNGKKVNPVSISYEEKYAEGLVRGVEKSLPSKVAKPESDATLRSELTACLAAKAAARPQQYQPHS
jgi:N-acetylmuramoyl-L-alanine amidase